MRLFFCVTLLACVACYPERDSDSEPNDSSSTAADAGQADETPAQESPDAGSDMPEEPTYAGQVVVEPEPTADAGSTPVTEEFPDAGLIQCETGYAENTATGECEDVNECLENNGGCLQTCLNTPGAFECGCFSGYALNTDDVSCHEVDECDTDNGGCQEVCINTVGAFECSCNGSRFLNEDGLTCQSNIESAQTVATNFGVGDISLLFDVDDVYEQGAFAGSVNFVDAFSKALESFLTDASDVYSPLEWVAGFDGTGDTLPLYMNQDYTYIHLVPNRARLSMETWYPPEFGESIEENWVFFMTGDAEMNALFWAIVPRNGEPVYNYGYD